MENPRRPHQLRSSRLPSMAPTAPPRMLPPPSKSLPPPSKTLSPPPSEAPLPLIPSAPAPRSSSAAALAPSLLLLLLASEQTELPAAGRVTPPFASIAACVGGEAGLGALVSELLPEAVCWAFWWGGAGALPAPVGAFLARIRSPGRGKAAVEKGVWKVGGREAVPKLGGWTKAGGAVAN